MIDLIDCDLFYFIWLCEFLSTQAIHWKTFTQMFFKVAKRLQVELFHSFVLKIHLIWSNWTKFPPKSEWRLSCRKIWIGCVTNSTKMEVNIPTFGFFLSSGWSKSFVNSFVDLVGDIFDRFWNVQIFSDWNFHFNACVACDRTLQGKRLLNSGHVDTFDKLGVKIGEIRRTICHLCSIQQSFPKRYFDLHF